MKRLSLIGLLISTALADEETQNNASDSDSIPKKFQTDAKEYFEELAEQMFPNAEEIDEASFREVPVFDLRYKNGKVKKFNAGAVMPILGDPQVSWEMWQGAMNVRKRELGKTVDVDPTLLLPSAVDSYKRAMEAAMAGRDATNHVNDASRYMTSSMDHMMDHLGMELPEEGKGVFLSNIAKFWNDQSSKLNLIGANKDAVLSTQATASMLNSMSKRYMAKDHIKRVKNGENSSRFSQMGAELDEMVKRIMKEEEQAKKRQMHDQIVEDILSGRRSVPDLNSQKKAVKKKAVKKETVKKEIKTIPIEIEKLEVPKPVQHEPTIKLLGIFEIQNNENNANEGDFIGDEDKYWKHVPAAVPFGIPHKSVNNNHGDEDFTSSLPFYLTTNGEDDEENNLNSSQEIDDEEQHLDHLDWSNPSHPLVMSFLQRHANDLHTIPTSFVEQAVEVTQITPKKKKESQKTGSHSNPSFRQSKGKKKSSDAGTALSGKMTIVDIPIASKTSFVQLGGKEVIGSEVGSPQMDVAQENQRILSILEESDKKMSKL